MRTRVGAAAIGLGFIVGLSGTVSAVTPARMGAAGGYSWMVPGGWTEGPARAMRVATYSVPGAAPAEAGECAVFFFGTGEGGSVDANVERWSKQFEGSPKAERAEKRVRDLRLTVVKIAGTYLAPGGPDMRSQGKRPGYLLRGAIAETPQGNIFFKLTGPSATVAQAEPAWESLLSTLGPASPRPTSPRTPIK